MRKISFIFSLLALLTLCSPEPAYAYIDPGIGSMLLQGLAAAIITGLIFFRGLREKIKTFFSKKSSTDHPAEPKNIDE